MAVLIMLQGHLNSFIHTEELFSRQKPGRVILKQIFQLILPRTTADSLDLSS